MEGTKKETSKRRGKESHPFVEEEDEQHQVAAESRPENDNDDEYEEHDHEEHDEQNNEAGEGRNNGENTMGTMDAADNSIPNGIKKGEKRKNGMPPNFQANNINGSTEQPSSSYIANANSKLQVASLQKGRVDAQGNQLLTDVVIHRPNIRTSFGLAMSQANDGSTRIHQIHDGGVASLCNVLMVGDTIMSVNHRNVSGWTYDRVMNEMRQSKLSLTLDVFRPKPLPSSDKKRKSPSTDFYMPSPPQKRKYNKRTKKVAKKPPKGKKTQMVKHVRKTKAKPPPGYRLPNARATRNADAPNNELLPVRRSTRLPEGKSRENNQEEESHAVLLQNVITRLNKLEPTPRSVIFRAFLRTIQIQVLHQKWIPLSTWALIISLLFQVHVSTDKLRSSLIGKKGVGFLKGYLGFTGVGDLLADNPYKVYVGRHNTTYYVFIGDLENAKELNIRDDGWTDDMIPRGNVLQPYLEKTVPKRKLLSAALKTLELGTDETYKPDKCYTKGRFADAVSSEEYLWKDPDEWKTFWQNHVHKWIREQPDHAIPVEKKEVSVPDSSEAAWKNMAKFNIPTSTDEPSRNKRLKLVSEMLQFNAKHGITSELMHTKKNKDRICFIPDRLHHPPSNAMKPIGNRDRNIANFMYKSRADFFETILTTMREQRFAETDKEVAYLICHYMAARYKDQFQEAMRVANIGDNSTKTIGAISSKPGIAPGNSKPTVALREPPQSKPFQSKSPVHVASTKPATVAKIATPIKTATAKKITAARANFMPTPAAKKKTPIAITKTKSKGVTMYDGSSTDDDHAVDWNIMYGQLLTYMSVNKSLNPPKSDRLGKWVSQQRLNFRLNKLLPARIKLLNGIGFPWGSVNTIDNKPPPQNVTAKPKPSPIINKPVVKNKVAEAQMSALKNAGLAKLVKKSVVLTPAKPKATKQPPVSIATVVDTPAAKKDACNKAAAAKIFYNLTAKESLLLAGFDMANATNSSIKTSLRNRERALEKGEETKATREVKRLLIMLQQPNGGEAMFGSNAYYQELVVDRANKGYMKPMEKNAMHQSIASSSMHIKPAQAAPPVLAPRVEEPKPQKMLSCAQPTKMESKMSYEDDDDEEGQEHVQEREHEQDHEYDDEEEHEHEEENEMHNQDEEIYSQSSREEEQRVEDQEEEEPDEELEEDDDEERYQAHEEYEEEEQEEEPDENDHHQEDEEDEEHDDDEEEEEQQQQAIPSQTHSQYDDSHLKQHGEGQVPMAAAAALNMQQQWEGMQWDARIEHQLGVNRYLQAQVQAQVQAAHAQAQAQAQARNAGMSMYDDRPWNC
mmetsp:Transcript_23703/g.34552  ORF Transcript_23703/g.34552 Transcript_23703/m.34552 type:complete len:1301 (-) Transcript_23703:113-4015(-)|eukprot:CAMPEP_0195524600 /NCGR_PEP_ID=MMETSP0794_2-20130614/24521_1 /TAXON_ID=515487 /ORGANISM="Stephanopyxis turris, Strain CCMP 815" /LENGTH=1300 /DNA_ID=CAMNT_0040654853 /DNA_START=149 /DNA_END=4051 /DNA_ORIENTATION=+